MGLKIPLRRDRKASRQDVYAAGKVQHGVLAYVMLFFELVQRAVKLCQEKRMEGLS